MQTKRRDVIGVGNLINAHGVIDFPNNLMIFLSPSKNILPNITQGDQVNSLFVFNSN
jgi:hypothetical protein